MLVVVMEITTACTHLLCHSIWRQTRRYDMWKPSFLDRFDRMFKIAGEEGITDRPTMQGLILDTLILLYEDYQMYLKRTPFDDRISFSAWLLGDWR